ncbi:hypothetical protein ACQ9ZF_11755 (plasmid) [Cetobacterium somerae]|nr:hypothetical protein [uncultured Cetobacterium sp.]
MAVPFFVYMMSSVIIKKLGIGGIAIVLGLVAKGVISSGQDLKKYLDNM